MCCAHKLSECAGVAGQWGSGRQLRLDCVQVLGGTVGGVECVLVVSSIPMRPNKQRAQVCVLGLMNNVSHYFTLLFFPPSYTAK